VAGDPSAPEETPEAVAEHEAENAPDTPPDLTKLSAKDKDILALRKQGHGYVEIGRRVHLSKTAVFDRVKWMQMHGFLDLTRPGEDEAEAGGPGQGAPAKSAVFKRAAGRAALEVGNAAATMAAETVDVWSKTGEWAWGKFNERAREVGYEDILEWLTDCVEYWETERAGWQTVLDEVHFLRQRVEQQDLLIEELRDHRTLRQELMELVMLANMTGRPFSSEQLSILVLGKDPSAQPVGPLPALPPG